VDNLGKKIHWIKVQIKCNGELAEALAEVLGRFVSNGIVIESITQFNPRMHENQPTGRVAVSGYLAVDQYLEEKQHSGRSPLALKPDHTNPKAPVYAHSRPGLDGRMESTL